MITINGTYTSATIFTTKNTETNIDDYALAQLQLLCDNESSKDCKIRVMPDVHPGKVGTIGLTMTIGERILPNLVGIDMGCGMTMAQINTKRIEYQKLDTVIREKVPSGSHIHSKVPPSAVNFDFTSLCCFRYIRQDKALLSLGTLGGGNHFIEIDQDDDGSYYAVVHSGSRHLGKEVTEYYLREGQKQLKENGIDIPFELTYLEGELKKQYLNDLQIVQKYAALNRELILDALAKGMKWKLTDINSCIHNYVEAADTTYNEMPILRKGAISAKKGENVIIPVNMGDGVIIGTGLGNEAWNCSAPHGAGRIMKREDVKSHFTLSSFKAEMKGIYSSCVTKDTLDEAPFAYRRLDEISEAMKETVTVNKIIRPVYNYKAGGN